MSKHDDSSDQVGEFIAVIVIAVIGAIAGVFFASWQKEKNTVHLPDTLEALPETLKPHFTFSIMDCLAVGIGSVSAMTFIGSLSFANAPGTVPVGLLIFACSFVGGYCAVKLWQKSQARKPQLPPPPQLEPFNLDKARAYTIALPHTTLWQPEVAYRFMEQILFKLGGRLTFRIIAVKGRIVWQILDLRAGVEPSVIEQAVLAYYPDAEIKAYPKSPAARKAIQAHDK